VELNQSVETNDFKANVIYLTVYKESGEGWGSKAIRLNSTKHMILEQCLLTLLVSCCVEGMFIGLFCAVALQVSI